MRLFALTAFLFAVPVFAQSNCTLVATPTSFSIPAGGYTGTISVTQPAGSNCDSYSVSTPPIWVHITSGASGPVPGTVIFIAEGNQGATSRTGTIKIGLVTITLTQDAAVCTFGVTPTSRNYTIDGNSLDTFAVQANCAWSAFQSDSWISLPLKPQGSSDGVVSFGVARNTCVEPRSGNITLSTGLPTPPVFAITQDGSQSNLTLSATSATPPAAAGDYRVSVNTGDSCTWNATSDVTWMTITNGSPGMGNGAIAYHLLANTLPSTRVGSIHVGALTYTVTQQAPPPPPVVLSSVVNAANYWPDAICPGEIVSLFGSNLGPPQIVTLQVKDNVVTSTLGGTQVLFDDVPAPIIFTSAGQVSTIVPYGLAGKSSTKVQVMYQGALSNVQSVLVQTTAPAIFTMDASGAGPGAILNQDYSLNSSANRAPRGSVISIYMTGGGATTPVLADGAVTPVTAPLLATTPVTVTIGGVNAPVQYAGGAPGSVAGLTQINVQVPANAPTGTAIPVIVKIGDYASNNRGIPTVAVQ